MNFCSFIGNTIFPKDIDIIVFEFLLNAKFLVHSEIVFKNEVVYRKLPSHFRAQTRNFALALQKEFGEHGNEWIVAQESGHYDKFREKDGLDWELIARGY